MVRDRERRRERDGDWRRMLWRCWANSLSANLAQQNPGPRSDKLTLKHVDSGHRKVIINRACVCVCVCVCVCAHVHVCVHICVYAMVIHVTWQHKWRCECGFGECVGVSKVVGCGGSIRSCQRPQDRPEMESSGQLSCQRGEGGGANDTLITFYAAFQTTGYCHGMQLGRLTHIFTHSLYHQVWK